MKRIIIFLAIISLNFCYFKFSFAGELKITQIDSSGGTAYNIIINDAIAICNISLKNKEGKNFVEFPVYAAGGKVYKQFSVLRRDYGEYLAYSIKENKISDYKGSTEFKINKFSKVKKNGNIKAFASVIFEDLLEAECRIMDGKNGLWVAWPARKNGGAWEPDFSFTDKKLKKQVESGLILRYNEENEQK
ncbi:MAG: SpoVG family protein [Endomicrobia bacterium]|nr:SpoVG family protein [Endomicrobiia bacterium]